MGNPYVRDQTRPTARTRPVSFGCAHRPLQLPRRGAHQRREHRHRLAGFAAHCPVNRSPNAARSASCATFRVAATCSAIICSIRLPRSSFVFVMHDRIARSRSAYQTPPLNRRRLTDAVVAPSAPPAVPAKTTSGHDGRATEQGAPRPSAKAPVQSVAPSVIRCGRRGWRVGVGLGRHR